MAALCNGQAIIFYPCGFYLSSSFFLLLLLLVLLLISQRSEIGCLPYFHTWCGLSANLERRSENAARGSVKIQDSKITQKSPSAHHCTSLLGHVFATKAHIVSRKKLVQQQYLLHMPSQYGELRPTSGWDLLGNLGHPSKFQRVSRLGSVTARHSSSWRQRNFAALNRERHLYLAGRPSRWELPHIL